METLSYLQPQVSPRGRRHAVTKSPHFLTATCPGHTLYHSTAEIISNGVRSNRTCTIQISNHLNAPLVDPRFHCFDGSLYYPLPPVIQPGTREVGVFSKDNLPSHGVIGVVTYQIGDSSSRLAIMFSVAYNQLSYRNHFGTAVIDIDSEQNEKCLFARMYADFGFYSRPGRFHTLANDGTPNFASDGKFQIRGSMSDRGKGIIKLNISNALF